MISNTEILFFILGYQGGTVHQLAKELNVSTSDILNADYERMQLLMRQAQTTRMNRIRKAIKPVITEISYEIDGGEECRGRDSQLSYWIRTLERI